HSRPAGETMKVPLAPAARPAATAASSEASISPSSAPPTTATAAGLPAFFPARPCRASSSVSVALDMRANLSRQSRPRHHPIGGPFVDSPQADAGAGTEEIDNRTL